jgi:tetratricopeptide (TPR) repeat protein
MRAFEPELQPAVFREIDRALAANNVLRATQLALQALDAGHRAPLLFAIRAHWKKREGRMEAALADFECVQEFDSANASNLNEIAGCLNALGRHRKAIAAASEAIELRPGMAMAWFHKGFAHQMLTELQPAELSYREAIRLDSTIVDAHGRLAGLAAARGDCAEARQHAANALAIQPNHPIAALTLASSALADGNLAEAEPRIQALLSYPTPLVRAVASSHLGDLRDAQGRTGEAFAAYRDAGAQWRAFYAPQFARRRPATDLLSRTTCDVDALPQGGWQVAGPLKQTGARLAFIMGFPRSGTTLLGSVFAGRANVTVLEERPLLDRAIAELAEPDGGVAKLAALSDAEIESYRADFWMRAARYGACEGLIIDQTALNTAYLPVILRLFPDAKIVFALRDPRDVVFSAFRRTFGPNPFTLEFHGLESTARLYDRTMTLAETCRDKLGFALFETRHETLIADFDGETKRLCGYLEIPWDESLRDHHKRHAAMATRSAAQVRRGLNSEGVGAWRRYATQCAPVLPVLAPWVKQFGYPAE